MTDDRRPTTDDRPEIREEAAAQAAAADSGLAEAQAPAASVEAEEAAAAAESEAAEQVELDLEELQAKAAERDEFLALAQRTQADFENYRKRAQRERGEAEARGVARLARELLPALDALERAMESTQEDSPLAEGVRLVHAELSAALARAGVEGFSPAGERFDPSVHEAVAQHTVEGAESGTVVDVLQRGYRLDGTVIRPARVVVAA